MAVIKKIYLGLNKSHSKSLIHGPRYRPIAAITINCLTRELKHADKILVLLQRGDEVLDYRQAQRYYNAAQPSSLILTDADGNHAMDDFEEKLPFVLPIFYRQPSNKEVRPSDTIHGTILEVLSGLDPVRRRPGMYTDTSRPNHFGARGD